MIHQTPDETKLWSLIYEKHVNGEKPGMRKWSRGKYFADLLNVYKDGINENERIILLRNIKRDLEIVKRDYKQASFVRECFKAKWLATQVDEISASELNKDLIEKLKTGEVHRL